MLPKCLLSIYIHSYRFVLLSTLVRDALFCNGQQQLMLRDSLLIQELRISDWILSSKWEIYTYIYVCIQNSSWRVKGSFRYDKNMLHIITYTHTLGFWEHCRGGGGKRRRWEYEERHYEMSSYGYDMVVIILKTQQLFSYTRPTQEKANQNSNMDDGGLHAAHFWAIDYRPLMNPGEENHFPSCSWPLVGCSFG